MTRKVCARSMKKGFQDCADPLLMAF